MTTQKDLNMKAIITPAHDAYLSQRIERLGFKSLTEFLIAQAELEARNFPARKYKAEKDLRDCKARVASAKADAKSLKAKVSK